MLSKAFWILISLELIGLVVGWFMTPDRPSDNGGGAMGRFFFMEVPAVILIGAALLFGYSTSRLAHGSAMAIAVAPLFLFLWFTYFDWVGDAWREHKNTSWRINLFDDPSQKALVKAILRKDAGGVKELAGRVKLNELRGDDYDRTFLRLAIEENKPETQSIVEALLAAGANPNLQGEHSSTSPLTLAVAYREWGVAAALLNRGVDPDAIGSYGRPNSHAAVAIADEEGLQCLRQMLDHGAQVNAVDDRGRTALILAGLHGNTKAIGLLLDRGADRTPVDQEGRTALGDLEQTMTRYATPEKTAQLQSSAERLRSEK